MLNVFLLICSISLNWLNQTNSQWFGLIRFQWWYWSKPKSFSLFLFSFLRTRYSIIWRVMSVVINISIYMVNWKGPHDKKQQKCITPSINMKLAYNTVYYMYSCDVIILKHHNTTDNNFSRYYKQVTKRVRISYQFIW